MKSTYLAFLSFAFVISGYCIFNPMHFSNKANNTYGYADAMGSEEDANARYNYELMLLRDPATGKIPDHIREKELAFASTLPNDWHPGFANAKTTTGNWQARGPWNVGGRTRAMAIDVSNTNNIIAGTCSGGMWRSTDQGLTWTMTTPTMQYRGTSCLTQDTRPGHTNVWYFGTGEGSGASASGAGAYFLGNGIYKSTDSGKTWNLLSSTTVNNLTTFDVWADVTWNMVTNPADSNHDAIFVAAYGGIYRSLDGGTTWFLAKGSSSNASYYSDVTISQSGIIYATLSSDGAQKGLYRSTDGTTFTNITPSGFPTTYNRIKIGISPSDENQIYFLGNTPGFGIPDTNFQGDVEWNSLWKYKYLSGDGSGTGGNWQDFSANLPSTGGQFDKFTCQGSYDLVVKVKPNDTNTVFIGGTNLYRSTSGFADASHTSFIGGYLQGASLPVVNSYPNHHPDQHELFFMPGNPDKMFSSNDGGVFVTNDNTASNVAWTSLNNGYISSMFYSCAIDHASTSDIIIGGAQDNGSWFTNSTNLTTPWVTPRGGDGSYCAIADNSSAYYFSIQNGKIMKAKLNAAGVVDSFARVDPIGAKGYQFINPFIIDPNNNNLMYLAAGRAIWRNNDLSGVPYAGNWDSISTNWIKFPDSLVFTTESITAITVSKSPANRLYYGTSIGNLYRIDNANTGTPAPTNISPVTFPVLFPSGATISSIATDPNNADHVLVTFSNYGVISIFYSDNGGSTWKFAAGNLEQNPDGSGDGPSVRWASIIPVNNGTVYMVGTSVGLFATSYLNGNSTVWVQQGTNNIGASVVDMIDHRATDGTVVVATHSGGIYSSHITDTNNVSVKNIHSIAETDLKLTNYPNPFSDQTTIQFNLDKAAKISLQVYDELGRLVSTLADEYAIAGEKSYIFRSGNLSTGIYYCVLKTNSLTQTRRVFLSKR